METEARRKRMIELLCARRHDTSDNLAKELGVSKRTIRRDIDAIGEDIPLYYKKGRYGGGIYVMEGYRSNRTYFCNEELKLLQKIFIHMECSIFTPEDRVLMQKFLEKYAKPSEKI